MVLKIMQDIFPEMLRAQYFGAASTCVQAHILGCASSGTTSFTDQRGASLLCVVAFCRRPISFGVQCAARGAFDLLLALEALEDLCLKSLRVFQIHSIKLGVSPWRVAVGASVLGEIVRCTPKRRARCTHEVAILPEVISEFFGGPFRRVEHSRTRFATMRILALCCCAYVAQLAFASPRCVHSVCCFWSSCTWHRDRNTHCFLTFQTSGPASLRDIFGKELCGRVHSKGLHRVRVV